MVQWKKSAKGGAEKPPPKWKKKNKGGKKIQLPGLEATGGGFLPAWEK